MKITLQRTSNTHHTLTIERPDGSRESMRCETRSYLEHDLIHLAVEHEARLSNGFWGALAAGHTLDALNDRDGAQRTPELEDSLMFVEKVVGVMTGLARTEPSEAAIQRAHDYLTQIGVTAPWLTPDFTSAVQARLRALKGHWSGTPFHEAMVVEWRLE